MFTPARELRREHYDAVGISFIVPNFAKAREMARMIRQAQPHAEIILGGHGASIEGIERLIDCDCAEVMGAAAWMRARGAEVCRDKPQCA